MCIVFLLTEKVKLPTPHTRSSPLLSSLPVFPALLHIDPKQIHFRFQLQYISLICTSPLISRLNLTLVAAQSQSKPSSGESYAQWMREDFSFNPGSLEKHASNLCFCKTLKTCLYLQCSVVYSWKTLVTVKHQPLLLIFTQIMIMRQIID